MCWPWNNIHLCLHARGVTLKGTLLCKDPGTEFLELSALAANDLYDGMAHSAGGSGFARIC